MPGKFKTEAIVLRSIRYGEADRVLHLYSVARGRIGAIAKGSRRPRSRFGGRLEPFFRLDLVLHEGRGDLATVTAASTVAAHPDLRSSGPALGAAARACDAVLRLLDSEEANPAAYNLLCRYLALLDGSEPAAGPPSEDGAAGLATALAFRLKLALAAGFAPELASCARCGEADGLSGFSGAAGGVVCAACERDGVRALARRPPLPGRGARPTPRPGPERRRALAAPGRARDRRDARASRPRAAAGGGVGPRGRGARPRLCLTRVPKTTDEPPAHRPLAERVAAWEDEYLWEPRGAAPTRRDAREPEPDSPLRTPFQRDRDRIVHSKAFRRLKHKTQVFVAPEGDHYRTRLTHTLETCGIARTVARALGLNEDLTEAIGLGHDLGHPPFGHIGEEALDEALRERGGSGASATTSTRCAWSRCSSATGGG